MRTAAASGPETTRAVEQRSGFRCRWQHSREGRAIRILQDLNLTQKGILIAMLPLIFSVLSTCVLAYLVAQAESEAARQRWARSVMDSAGITGRAVIEAIAMGSLYSATK